MEEKLIKEFSDDRVFWQAYWVGVAQGLWISAAVEVDRILTEDQKNRFDTQLEKWQEANKTLLEETIPEIQIDKIIQKVKEDINICLCVHIPMQLEEAITILKEAHLEMKSRNASGEYYLALAIDPGDAKLRQPTRFWIFDYSSISGYRWVAYPRSLPGIYTKIGFMSVNGHYPMEYLTENGELISMRECPDVIAHPSEPILIGYGSTTARLKLRDDSGRNVQIMLSP